MLSDVRESMERVKKVFSGEERVVYDRLFNKVKIRKIKEKRGKIRKTWSMTKNKNEKRSSEIFAAKLEIFSEKKRHLGRRKFFPSPQTRRQVSATAAVHQRT